MRALALLLAILPATSAFAQRAHADLTCHFTGTDFVYDCVVRLTRGGLPVKGAQIVVGADMPSMPMAHNLAPVKARPGRQPGEYHARLDLEMTGEWAIKLRLSGALRDLIVLHYEFDERGARPAPPRSRTGRSPAGRDPSSGR